MNPSLRGAATEHVRWSSGTVQGISSKSSFYFCSGLDECSVTAGLFCFRFESCWPALMKDSSGVAITFNPDVPTHLKEIETWHSVFVSSQGLQDSQCLLIAHHKPGSEAENGRLPLGNNFRSVFFNFFKLPSTL